MLRIATDRLLAGLTVIVTATNPAGEATSRFRLTVAAAELAPSCWPPRALPAPA